ncbi:EAL domain-containing protein [Psychrosphaera sp. B3R10]|nr:MULTISPECIES: bifunctional diguanylate cyclase/phosphodiesterase [unclassified Psychrosphaera]MBU2880601.1 EAL domain-containing protein [Psychrosphaera sp. I2R16]MBU2990687.1 EAL domain-containing protein [Psychrosphaera sp. B3R10]
MKLSRQLFVIHSLIITLLVAGYAWLSLLNVRQLTVQELVNQSNTAAQYLSDPLHLALMSANQELYQAKIDSFYDAGNYSRISLFAADATKSVLYQRTDLSATAGVPLWFQTILPLEVIMGSQELYRGIDKIGELEVEIHPYAFYQFIWRQFTDMLSITIFVGLIAWALGLALFNIVLRPISAVQRQAAAVANKHYPQIETRSGIAEFEQLIQAHNDMTKQIKILFDTQQERMDELKHSVYHDTVSGLPNREYFNSAITDVINTENDKVHCGLVVVHLTNLGKLKLEQGFPTYKTVLEFVKNSVERTHGLGKNIQLFQLNEQEMGVLLLHFGAQEIVDFTKDIAKQMVDCTPLKIYGGAVLGAVELLETDTNKSLLKRVDTALKHAITQGKRFYVDSSVVNEAGSTVYGSKGELLAAMETARVEFFLQPVVSTSQNTLLFTELYTKLTVNDQPVSLGTVITMAEKFDVTAVLDQRILEELHKHFLFGAVAGKISINVSAFSLKSEEFMKWLVEMLESSPGLANNLIMEFDEIDLSHCQTAREASFRIANMGVQIAIDHFGRGSSSLARFSDMKVHWLKLDSRYINHEDSSANKDYLSMICDLVDKLGVNAVIPNIETHTQLDLAKEVGAYGVQGFLIAKPLSIYEQI